MRADQLRLDTWVWINTNHTNLPGWAWQARNTQVMARAITPDGQVTVETGQGDEHHIHVAHLCSTPPPAARATTVRPIPGPDRRIDPAAGEELALDLGATS